MRGPSSNHYFSQRLRLHYVDWGNDGAPPLLLIHGGMDHCRNWDWVAEDLCKDYHIIAPDLRGHGDSDWVRGGTYHIEDIVYDLAQLVHQKDIAPVTIISHSFGGRISLLYASLYPENVKKLVTIEGFVPALEKMREAQETPIADYARQWVDRLRNLSARTPRRYPSLEDAFQRMQQENPHLSEQQARHLTIHGSNQNEDGTYSWKFDNYMRAWMAFATPLEDVADVYGNITCPVLMLRGTESWIPDQATDVRAKNMTTAKFVDIEHAGHWLHHDRLDEFLRLTKEFLAG